ncbi:hypothetical protein MNV49_007048 [Pseudohyphozyma bogoriensis]|nr:hypothetical protein MNV49_007048 [Pseudohyphozyma bogoriensis]
MVRLPTRSPALSFFSHNYPSPSSTRRSFSFNSNNSNNGANNGGPPRFKPSSPLTATSTPRPSTSTAPTPSTSASTSKKPSSSIAPTPAPTPSAPKKATPLAPTLTHITSPLISIDQFFALHRPLLELPIKIPLRRSVAPVSTLRAPESSLSAIVDSERDVGHSADGEELVEVVDLDAEGTPMGPSYITTLSASNATEPLRNVIDRAGASDEFDLADEELAAHEEKELEAAERDYEEGVHVDPYEAWLIGEPEGTALRPHVSRYLAARPPFTVPTPPTPPAPKPEPAPTTLSPQNLSDLSFLQPFPSSASKPSDPENQLNDAFNMLYLDPLTPVESSQVADRYLTDALLTQHYKSFADYANTVSEKLAGAARAYSGEEVQQEEVKPRRAFMEKRQRGEVRMWSEEKGWETIDAGLDGASPFLPAEMVDLDYLDEHQAELGILNRMGFADEQEALKAMRQVVRMDSVKRKRIKKIKKHKYKKRRKEQEALRKRLGK